MDWMRGVRVGLKMPPRFLGTLGPAPSTAALTNSEQPLLAPKLYSCFQQLLASHQQRTCPLLC